jgi:hypothetical protein
MVGALWFTNAASVAGRIGGALACGLGAAVLLACRRPQRLYAAVVIAVVFSMVVVPLMQGERAAAFFDRLGTFLETRFLTENGSLVDNRGNVC